MKKYNLSKIMHTAWSLFRKFQKWACKLSFGECLRRAWKSAKAEIQEAKVKEQVLKYGARVQRTIYGEKISMGRAINGEWTLDGKTYALRKIIKGMGFQWDAESRCWYTGMVDVAMQFAQYSGL